jgi:hypothetical protein
VIGDKSLLKNNFNANASRPFQQAGTSIQEVGPGGMARKREDS